MTRDATRRATAAGKRFPASTQVDHVGIDRSNAHSASPDSELSTVREVAAAVVREGDVFGSSVNSSRRWTCLGKLARSYQGLDAARWRRHCPSYTCGRRLGEPSGIAPGWARRQSDFDSAILRRVGSISHSGLRSDEPCFRHLAESVPGMETIATSAATLCPDHGIRSDESSVWSRARQSSRTRKATSKPRGASRRESRPVQRDACGDRSSEAADGPDSPSRCGLTPGAKDDSRAGGRFSVPE